MQENNILDNIHEILKNRPEDWLKLTTHRLDIYNEKLAKKEFLAALENLFSSHNFTKSALEKLPTAYDYIRLGHPLSCILEWTIAKLLHSKSENIISFASKTMPVLAVLRKNLLKNKNTLITYTGQLPEHFNSEILKEIYGYQFELKQINSMEDVPAFNGSTIFIAQENNFSNIQLSKEIDFFISLHSELGSILIINGKQVDDYISEIQHVRRRESIAMTPANSEIAIKLLLKESIPPKKDNKVTNKKAVLELIKQTTGTQTKPIVSSCGLTIQYAIMMGLIHDAVINHPEKKIKFLVPPNCYGGTNDQARRVAECIENVEIVDLPVDRENDMVISIDTALNQIAIEDAIPYIIAEIPTNPRVEVPDLINLKNVLSKQRKTSKGEDSIPPVFILDQTFCPNIRFLGAGEILSSMKAISYASGSKFPSGGKVTSGYCVGNDKAKALIEKIEKHLTLCDNEATPLQYEILAKQLPSMEQRIKDAYKNARDFVHFIHSNLPEAKINFVSDELASQGFTPSVFSLDLPTKGNTKEERETFKRSLNLKLINAMITKIPQESKYCVSYGQLKGCYWTIPATSTQGTTKEGDKDYIVRVSVSGNLDLELHKKVFKEFVEEIAE